MIRNILKHPCLLRDPGQVMLNIALSGSRLGLRRETLEPVCAAMLALREATDLLFPHCRKPVVSVGVLPPILLADEEERSVFWAHTQEVQVSMRPLFLLSGWVTGCPCHEEKLRRHIRLLCPRKGCRGPELAGNVQETVSELLGGERRHASAGIRDEAARLLSAKFRWLKELPYNLWLVRHSRQDAKDLLQQFETGGECIV